MTSSHKYDSTFQQQFLKSSIYLCKGILKYHCKYVGIYSKTNDLVLNVTRKKPSFFQKGGHVSGKVDNWPKVPQNFSPLHLFGKIFEVTTFLVLYHKIGFFKP